MPRAVDKPLLIIVGLLVLVGFVMLFSASGAVGIERFGDSAFYVKRQLVSFVVGLALFWIGWRVDYHLWQKWSLPILIAALALLVLVLIPGIGASGQGAVRWINLGFTSFQPTEFAKLALILYISAWLSERGLHTVRDVKHGLVPFASLMAVFAFLILKQPDLGTLLIIVAIGGVLFFVGGADARHIAGLVVAGIVFVGIAIKIAPYRLARFTAFLDPAADPQGAGYHITQALLAIGSGGLFGLGLGNSRQKYFYLPEVTGDSLFAVIGEELGFFASAGIVVLFALFFLRGLRIALRAPDTFGKLAALGIAVWVAAQAFMNIGAMLGVLPLTGLPLPLMSYGGTALAATLAGIGILLNIAKQGRRI